MSEQPKNLGKRAASALMLSLWLGTLALVICPQLHGKLHSDAQDLSHRCLVTQVQQQGVLSGLAPATILFVASPPFELGQRVEPRFLTSSDRRLSPSRAPPFFFLP